MSTVRKFSSYERFRIVTILRAVLLSNHNSMKRRNVLKSMAVAVGGAVALPSWASQWAAEQLPTHSFLSNATSTLLATVVETIIPKTDTPGATDLGIGPFVEKMVADCYSKTVQEHFAKGLMQVDALAQTRYNKGFVQCDTAQKIAVLKAFENHSDTQLKEFYGLVKQLTILGYMNSEYVMNNITHYEMVPGRFHGCVPVK